MSYLAGKHSYNKTVGYVKKVVGGRVSKVSVAWNRSKLAHQMRNRMDRYRERAGVPKRFFGCLEDISGCSMPCLVDHIEQQFEPWMSWDNLGVPDANGNSWNIDHDVPLKFKGRDMPVGTTDKSTVAIPLNEKLNRLHYTNMRPMCVKQNEHKGNRYSGPFRGFWY